MYVLAKFQPRVEPSSPLPPQWLLWGHQCSWTPNVGAVTGSPMVMNSYPSGCYGVTNAHGLPTLLAVMGSPMLMDSQPSGCYGVTNTYGRSLSQQEVSIIASFNCNTKYYLSPFIALKRGLSFLFYQALSNTKHQWSHVCQRGDTKSKSCQ